MDLFLYRKAVEKFCLIGYAYDKNGNLTQKGDVKYTYNARNLLESYVSDAYTESYTYNAFGLLSSIQQNDVTTTLTWDILNVDGVVISAAKNGEVTDYSYGIERISAQTKGNRTEYVYDARGSVIAEVNSKFLNTEITTKAYTPFGEQLNDNASGFGYNGEYYNAATGMIYLRARFYEPAMNRFSQKDSVRGTVIMPESLNRYVYCANDPVNLIDPSGRTWSSAVQKLKNVGSNIASSFKANPVKTVVQGAAAVATAITHPIATAVAATVAVGSFVAEVCKPAQPATQPATPPAPQPGPPPVPNPNPGPQYSDGGNNQREQTIYHSTYTPTPSYTPTYQTPAVTQPAQQVCNGGKGTVLQIIINKLKDSSNATKQSVSEKFNENTIHIYKEGEGEDDPNKFNIRITSNDVYNNIQIPDSIFVKSNAERSAVLDVIMSSEYYSEEKYGTKEHMMAQWQAHNAAYVVANGMNAIGELTNTENFMEKVYPYIFGGATNPIKSAETLDIREIGNTNSRQDVVYSLLETINIVENVLSVH